MKEYFTSRLLSSKWFHEGDQSQFHNKVVYHEIWTFPRTGGREFESPLYYIINRSLDVAYYVYWLWDSKVNQDFVACVFMTQVLSWDGVFFFCFSGDIASTWACSKCSPRNRLIPSSQIHSFTFFIVSRLISEHICVFSPLLVYHITEGSHLSTHTRPSIIANPVSS